LAAVISPLNILAMGFGALFGIVFGLLPGLGPMAALAAGLPFTFKMPAVTGVIFLASIFCTCGASDAIPSILISTPGGPHSVALTWDGNALTKQGKGGYSLGLATGSGVVGIFVGWLLLVFSSAIIVALSMYFGPAEYAALALMGLIFIGGEMTKVGMAKSVLIGLFGVLLSMIGLDDLSGVARFTFGISYLDDGVPLMAVVIGVFALSEAFLLVGQKPLTGVQDPLNSAKKEGEDVSKWTFRRGFFDCLRYYDTLIRSLGIGSLYGVLPAVGPAGANVVAYYVERSAKKGPPFGTGNPRGVIAPEVARGSCSMLDMLTTFGLGIPGSPHGAIFLAAIILYGIEPGTRFFSSAGVLPYALYLAFPISVLVYLLIVMFASPYFIKVVQLPPRIVGVGILIFGLTGVLVSRGYIEDVLIAAIFGLMGLIFKRFNLPSPSLVLGLVIGQIFEVQFRRGMLIGGWSYFISRPVAVGLFLVTVILGYWVLRSGSRSNEATK
jgi:putative tricarboxylic transport membrane protein